MTDFSLKFSHVADFLRTTPQFFSEYPEFILLPNDTETNSLTHRHLEQLRKKIETQALEHQWLSDNAQQNQKTIERLHQLNLALIRFAFEHKQSFNFIEQALKTIFELDFSRIITVKNTSLMDSVDESHAEFFETYGTLMRPQCSSFLDDETSLLRKIMPPQVASYALVPLIQGNGSLNGLLILGDLDKQRFTPNINTLFLQQISIQLSLLIECIDKS